jgi:hypothetical protein
MDIVGLLRKERAELMGKVNAVDAAIKLLSGGSGGSGGGNAPRANSPMSEKDRLRRSAAMKAHWRKRRAAQHKKK